VLIGLRRLNDAVVGNSSMLGGYELGEISLSRSILTESFGAHEVDIFFF